MSCGRSPSSWARNLDAVGRAAAVLLLLALASPRSAASQEFGQWSWDAALGLTRRDYSNSLSDATVGTLGERDLGLSLGVNGFVLHPSVARFRLGLDAQLSSYRSERSRGTRRWGARGDLNVFPVGKYRVSLFGTRKLYDYSGLTEEDPLTLLGVPDASTGFGGRLRLTSGPLRGLLAGFERNRLGFLSREARAEVEERELLDWSRAGRTFARHLSLERRSHDYGTVDFATDDLTASYDHRGSLSPSWRWDAFAAVLRRDLAFEGKSSSFDDVRATQHFVRTRGRGLVDLGYSGGLTRGEGLSFQSHTVSGRYRWRPNERWDVGPFATYGVQASGGSTVRSPQLGASAVWTRPGAMDISFSNSVGYALLQRGGTAGSRTDSLLTLAVGGSLGHGKEATLREELEASWSRNQLRLAGEALAELPDLGARLAGTGMEDLLRGRLTLRRRWGPVLCTGYGEWARREVPGVPSQGGFSLDTLTQSLQLGGSGFSLLANVGEAKVRGAAAQEVRSRSVSASWTPWRLVSLTASYRTDTRELALAPSLEGDRVEGGVDLGLGAFVLQGHGFVTRERRPSLAERTNRGFVLTVSRRFWGWLPIVTGVPRAGVIE